jgi:hypothetical protein
MANYADELNPGQLLGTTQIYDLSGYKGEDFNVRLRQNFNNVLLTLNTKDSGYYSQEEFVNGQLFYPDYSRVNSGNTAPPTFRQIYRKVIETGQLPDAGTTNTAHGLNVTGNFIFTRIYGCASDQTGNVYIPLPYSSAAGATNIELSVSALTVDIVTASNRTAFTKSHVVLEYIKF